MSSDRVQHTVICMKRLNVILDNHDKKLSSAFHLQAEDEQLSEGKYKKEKGNESEEEGERERGSK